MQTKNFPFLVKVIEQWSVRLRRAGKNQKQLANLADISEVTLSQTISLKNKNPKLTTIQKVEDALEKWGV